MRVLVNAMAASKGGALSILKDFYTYVRDNDVENEWIFLISGNYIEETAKIKVIQKEKKTWFHRLYFDFIGWKEIIKQYCPDSIFSLQNTIFFHCPVSQILYVHQTLPFQKEKKFSFLKKEERINAMYQHVIGKLIKFSIKRASSVIVQTEWMKKEIEKITDKRKVYKIQPSVTLTDYNKDEITWNSDKFIYPTSEVIYKNNALLYEACEKLNEKGENYEVELTISSQNVCIKHVNFIGKINREELLKKYKESTLVFPSYIETFGLPLLEARMSGTIILAADTAFAREILDGYENAYFFDAFKVEELLNLMEAVIHKKIEIKSTKNIKNIESNGWEVLIRIIKKNAGMYN